MDTYQDPILTPEEQKLPLEDRREAAKEHALRWLMEHPGAATTFRKGVAQYDKDWGKSRVLPWHQSMTKAGPEAEHMPLRKVKSDPFVNWTVPELKRRTLDERIQGMVKRLLVMEPMLQESLIAQIAGEYWKEGSPVTVTDLRTVAAHYLNRAERHHPSPAPR